MEVQLVQVLLAQSALLLVTQVEVILVLEVQLVQAAQVTLAVVDSRGVLLVSQVFNDGYKDRQLIHTDAYVSASRTFMFSKPILVVVAKIFLKPKCCLKQ